MEALGVAAFAIQIVDFGAKILSKANEITRRGKTIDQKALTDITQDLEKACKNLGQSLGPAGHDPDDNPIANLGIECQAVAAELLTALKKLSGVVGQSKWRSFRQAMLTIWRAEHIEVLERRLDGFRQQLILRMLESLREQLRDLYDKSMSLDVEIGRSFFERLQENEQMQRKLAKDIEDRLVRVIQAQHETTQTRPSSMTDPPQPVFDRQKLRLLASLKFHEMTSRHDRIPRAARNTFEWIYRAPRGDEPWSSFVDWLRGDDGLYWITGKPGSGKSTLMKFLDDDVRTGENVRQWSRHHPLICASFYFWNSGTEIQMSNEGLARSLLHSMCQTSPELIPDIFPDRWEALHLFGATHKRWTMAELLCALRMIATPTFSNRRFFFLIDGLDEFEGDKGELVDLLKAMGACKHVKICVSSRPWIEFQEAFALRPSLRVEDLTLSDIQVYVESSFNASPRFSEIRQRDPASAYELFTAIAERSSGVFLWVHLVVKSLLQGIRNGDKFTQLRERLAELPSDLKNLFQNILDRTEPRYQPDASRLFRIHHEHGSISLLRFAFADEDGEFLRRDDQHVPLSMDEFLFRCTQMKNRIDSRTKGLLEVTKWSPVEESQRTSKEVPAGLRYKWQVQYLHRTVRDYFSRPEIWLMLSTWAPGFDPYLSLCQALILEVKYLALGDAPANTLQQCMNKALMLASMADIGSRQTLIGHLDAVNSITASLMKQGQVTLTPLDPSLPPHHAPLFPLAIEFDLDFYVGHLLSNGHPTTSRKHFDSYISFAIEKRFPETWVSTDVQCLRDIKVLDGQYPVSNKSLELLIRHGATFYDKRGEEPYLKHLRIEFAEVCFRVVSDMACNTLLMEYWLVALELLASLGADLSGFWSVIPKRKVAELDKLAPQLGTRLRDVLKVEEEDQPPPNDGWSNSPRIRAREKRKKRRDAAAAAAKRVRGH